LAFDGTASFRAVRANQLSSFEGWSRALKPRRTAATAPANISITAEAPAATPSISSHRSPSHIYCGCMEGVDEGTLSSRTGWSISPGRLGASRPSVKRKPFNAIELPQRVSRAAI